MIKTRLIVKGRVQGVFYRQSTQEKAHSLGLSGWVRNLADGSVEIEAIGEPHEVEQLVAWCHSGPPAAKVSEVQIQDRQNLEKPVPAGSSFSIQ